MKVTIHRSVAGEAVRAVLRSQLRFHYPQIAAVSFRDGVVEVDLPAGAEPSPAEVRALAVRIIESFSQVPDVPVRVRYDSSAPAQQGLPVSHDLAVFGYAARALIADLAEDSSLRPRCAVVTGSRPAGRGLNLYGHQIAALQRCLDQFLRRYFQRAYGAEEVRAPSMIPAAVADRADYVAASRQHLSFVCPLITRPESFDEFLPYWREATAGSGSPDARISQFLRVPMDVLNPALCLHCYPIFESARIPDGHPAALTLSGSCFRDESGNLNYLDRLREFTMREAVFIGDAGSLDAIHDQLISFVVSAADLLGLDFLVESATDIFFSDGAPERIFSQLLSDNKLEVAVRVPGADNPVAVASINKHQTHFTNPFDIRISEDVPAVSMCAGFGLDRLALAVCRSAGTDADLLSAVRDVVATRMEAQVK